MNCQYCGRWVAEDDHRCQHCGRRLRSGAPVNRGSTAPKLETQVLLNSQVEPVVSRRPVPHQPALFSLREFQKVVSIAPPQPHRERNVRREPVVEPNANRLPPRRYVQQSLNFPTPARHDAVIEGVLSRDTRVASPVHRLIAAAADVSLVLIGIVLFAGVLNFLGGDLEISRRTMPYVAGIAALIWLSYKALWCSLGLDSPGMNWSRLRTLNFDGHAPTFEQRFKRLVASILSLAAAGLGLLWALADEEKLTWHDHISRTFVTIDDTPGSAR